jgi:hypothetical protein
MLRENNQSSAQDYSLGAWRKFIGARFPELVTPAEAVMSVIAQLLIKDITNCFALVLVDMPSAGKTIVLNFFDGIEGLTYGTDDFTPASFVSRAANVKKKQLDGVDLLPRIRGKAMIVRDLAPIFSKREDDMMQNLGVLTRVLDGEGYWVESGVHGRRGYAGDYKFMLIAASTPIRQRVWNAMSALGPRLQFLHLNTHEATVQELANLMGDTSYKEKERQCRKATHEFLKNLQLQHSGGVEWNKERDDESCKQFIARCAKLMSALRSEIVVNREGFGRDEKKEYEHIKEMPYRSARLLCNLAQGHALCDGRTWINLSDTSLVYRVALDSGVPRRSRLVRQLIENGGELRSGDVQTNIERARPIVNDEMRKLCIIGLCEMVSKGSEEMRIRLSGEFAWFGTKELQKYLHYTGAETLNDALSESAPVLASREKDQPFYKSFSSPFLENLMAAK